MIRRSVVPWCAAPAVLIWLACVAGCGSTGRDILAPAPDAGDAPTTNLLVGPLQQPALLNAAADAWRKAAAANDQVWMEGLEKRYAFPLAHLALTAYLGEPDEILSAMGPQERALLIQRFGLETKGEDTEWLEDWKSFFLEGDFEEAASLPAEQETARGGTEWLRVRARALALFQSGRYQEASDQLNRPSGPHPVLERRNRLLRIESLRRSGQMDQARGEWVKLADLSMTEQDVFISAPLLDSAQSLENLSDLPFDRGRIVSLGEMAETSGDITRAFRAYQKIWSDPRLGAPAEIMAIKNSVIRRAGLGVLRIIAGGAAQGDPSFQVTRWRDLISEEPLTPGRAACECELWRFEGAVNLKQGRLAQALASCTEAVKMVDLTGDAILIARARGDLAVVLANCGEIEKAIQTSEEACRAAEASGDRKLIYETQRNRLILIAGTSDDAPEALRNRVMEQGKRLGRLDPEKELELEPF